MDSGIKKRKFALIGLVYGIVLSFWGMIISGGGHFNLPGMLIMSPFGIGLLFWAIWGFLSVDFTSLLSKCLFLLLMVAHLAGLVFYLYLESDSEFYWLGIAMNEPTFIVFLLIQVAFYLAAQIYLWSRFLRYSFGREEMLRRLNE